MIGSANLNDRSFVGDSDSELGVIIWDDEMTCENQVAGVTVTVGLGLRAFRLDLFRTYLGLRSDRSEDAQIMDPIAAFDLWRDVGRANRELLSQTL